MPRGVPKSGKRKCSPRVDRVTFDCEVCGTKTTMLPAAARQRTGRYCSKACAASDYSRPVRKIAVQCSHCSTRVQRWPSEIKGEATYCNVTCRREAEVSTFSWTEWRARNVDRQIEKEREWRARNPEAVARAKRKWRESNRHALRVAATHRRLLKQSDNAATSEQIAQLLAEADGKCAYCGGHSEALELDHFVPVSRGGDGAVENLIPCCRTCNATKGAKTPDAWLKECTAKGWPTDVYKIKKAILAAQGIYIKEV